MGAIDVGAAVRSGFGLIRRKPEAIIVWGDPQAFFSQPPAMVFNRLAPLLVGLAVAAIPLYGMLYALMSAPIAKAYLDLRGDPAEAF